MDRIPVRQCVVEPLEDDHPDAAAADGALGAGVERAAVAVGRADSPLLVQVAVAFAAR